VVYSSLACEANITADSCITTGDGVLSMHNFNASFFKWDLIILLGMYFAFHTLSFLALSRRARHVVG
jgi:hypothetical protein